MNDASRLLTAAAGAGLLATALTSGAAGASTEPESPNAALERA